MSQTNPGHVSAGYRFRVGMVSCTIVLSMTLLYLLPALYNGFPLVFPDTPTYTDLRKFLDTSVPSISGDGLIAGTPYRAGETGAQATVQSERIKASSAANRFQAISQASMMSARLAYTELASQWLRR